MDIQMVDLKGQYENIKNQIDKNIQSVINDTAFINGKYVDNFKNELSSYLGDAHVIPCANGTDALQIALMALDLKEGDEIIVPAFTYAATAEVIGLLGFTPVMCDVDSETFNIDKSHVEHLISNKTKCIIAVHLFGQCSDMDSLKDVANEYGLKLIEDNAQSIGAVYTHADGRKAMAGTIGNIGTTSFFPSKNLGCYGDGGALFSRDEDLAQKLQMIANHGQIKKYHHHVIGCNSRLDGIQAAILNTKLPYLDQYANSRIRLADKYDEGFRDIDNIVTPKRASNSSHVFHQYTIKVKAALRDELQTKLNEVGIPTGIYYPIPLYRQNAFSKIVKPGYDCPISEQLCKEVISLPMHTEMSVEQSDYIIDQVKRIVE